MNDTLRLQQCNSETKHIKASKFRMGDALIWKLQKGRKRYFRLCSYHTSFEILRGSGTQTSRQLQAGMCKCKCRSCSCPTRLPNHDHISSVGAGLSVTPSPLLPAGILPTCSDGDQRVEVKRPPLNPWMDGQLYNDCKCTCYPVTRL